MWDLIISVPDHCLPFYFSTEQDLIFFLNSVCIFTRSFLYNRAGSHWILY